MFVEVCFNNWQRGDIETPYFYRLAIENFYPFSFTAKVMGDGMIIKFKKRFEMKNMGYPLLICIYEQNNSLYTGRILMRRRTYIKMVYWFIGVRCWKYLHQNTVRKKDKYFWCCTAYELQLTPSILQFQHRFNGVWGVWLFVLLHGVKCSHLASRFPIWERYESWKKSSLIIYTNCNDIIYTSF